MSPILVAKFRHIAAIAALLELAIASLLVAGTVAKGATPGIKTFVLVVGAERSIDSSLPPLRYAIADAERFAEAIRTVGKVPAAQITLLKNTSVFTFREALLEIKKDLNAANKRQSQAPRFVFYFSGHADRRGLHLRDGFIDRRDVQDILGESAAHSRIVLLDSCQAASLTAKGVEQIAKTPVILPAEPGGSVALTATSSDESAFESAQLHGSLFTDALVEGLYGKADSNHDGLVSIEELYQYIYRQIRFNSLVDPNGAIQHPEMFANLAGQGALILAYPKTVNERLQLGAEISGVVTLAAQDGLRFFRYEKAAGAPETVELPPGHYEVEIARDNKIGEAKLDVKRNAANALALGDFVFREKMAITAAKGASPDRDWRLALGQHPGYFSNETVGPQVEMLHSRTLISPFGNQLRSRLLVSYSRRRQWEIDHEASAHVNQAGIGAGLGLYRRFPWTVPSAAVDVIPTYLQQKWSYVGHASETFVSYPIDLRLQLGVAFPAGVTGADWGFTYSFSTLFLDEVHAGREVLFANMFQIFLSL